MPYRSQTQKIQQALLDLGYKLPKFGADGIAGKETFDAALKWVENMGEPVAAPGGIKPAGIMKRVVWHWSAWDYEWSGPAAEHYHFGVDGNGVEHVGDHSPEDNIDCYDGDYAAHVSKFNTRAIGISAMAMRGAFYRGDTGEINWGSNPLLPLQVDWFINKTAELCREYQIPVSRETTLSHAEVWETFGIWQKGKWDLMCLPGWTHVKTAVEVGDIIRDRINDKLRSL